MSTSVYPLAGSFLSDLSFSCYSSFLFLQHYVQLAAAIEYDPILPECMSEASQSLVLVSILPINLAASYYRVPRYAVDL